MRKRPGIAYDNNVSSAINCNGMIVAVIAQTDDVHLKQMALIMQQGLVIIYW